MKIHSRRNNSRLLKIDLWTRRIAVIYLVIYFPFLVAILQSQLSIFIDPEPWISISGDSNLGIRISTILEIIRSFFLPIFVFLTLFGISKTIRYLLELEADIRSKYAAQVKS